MVSGGQSTTGWRMRCPSCPHVQPVRAWCEVCGAMLGPDDRLPRHSLSNFPDYRQAYMPSEGTK